MIHKKKIILSKKERYFLYNRFFLITSGSVSAYEIFENGKYLPKFGKLKTGDIIGNYFHHFMPTEFNFPEIEIEVVALEDNTVLEEFNFDFNQISNNFHLNKLISQLIQENLFKLFYHLYDKKRYILAVLKYYSNSSGTIFKDQIRIENFSMSKSQFYSLYNELKNDKLIIEEQHLILLNLEKIDSYLNLASS